MKKEGETSKEYFQLYNYKFVVFLIGWSSIQGLFFIYVVFLKGTQMEI